jgi:hypothetical protein
MHLARAEAIAAVSAVVARLRGLRLAPGEELPAVEGFLIRSPRRLPVVFDGQVTRSSAEWRGSRAAVASAFLKQDLDR